LWTADNVYASAWLPDNSGVAQSVLRGGDPRILLYDSTQLREAWDIPFGLSMALAVAPDSKLLAIPDPTENFVDFVELGDGSTARPSLASTSCWGASIGLFDPTGTILLTGHFPVDPSPRSSVYAWNLQSNSCQPILLEHEGVLQSLRLSHDGTVLATGLSELYSRESAGEPTSQVVLWDFPSMQFRCWLPGQWARFNPAGDLIAVSGNSRQTIAFYDIQNCQLRRDITSASWPFDLSPTTALLASASSNSITFYDGNTGDTVQVLPWRYQGTPDIVEFSPKGDLLLVASKGNGLDSSATITMWQVPPPPP
jgi:WD40 repeat protein